MRGSRPNFSPPLRIRTQIVPVPPSRHSSLKLTNSLIYIINAILLCVGAWGAVLGAIGATLSCLNTPTDVIRLMATSSIYLTAILVIAVGTRLNWALEKSKPLYLLTLLPYFDNDTSPITDGAAIIAGAELAVAEINNRSDLLENYRLELIPANGGCILSWKSVISLIDNLYYGGKQIVGIIGPVCSDAAKAVASLTGKPEIALINVHLASAPELADRSIYPYTFGIYPSTTNCIDSMVALFAYNNWTRAAVLYSRDTLRNYNSFLLFQEKLNGAVNLSFVSPATLDYIPLDALRNTYVRVIVSFLRDDTLQRTLCLAYHMGMTYPKYQWIILGDLLEQAPFEYYGKSYTCNQTAILNAFNHSLNCYYEINLQPEVPKYTQLSFVHLFGICGEDLSGCSGLFDAVWAFAVALNNSIEPFQRNGLSLSNYTYGREKYTQIIRQQMYWLNFTGLTGGLITFNQHDGYISSPRSAVFEITPPVKLVATYSDSDGIQVDQSIAVFVSTNFEEVLILVSLPLAAVFIAVDAIAALLVLGIHFVNTAYRNHKAIKASSTRLNHFAYAGCYLIILASLMYTITETFPVSKRAKSVLCNAFPWALSIGLTLVLGTVTAKTCRLYYIFNSSSKLKKSYLFMMSDAVLSVVIIVLVTLVIGLCTAWTTYDPYQRNVKQTLLPSGDTLIITKVEFCSCKFQIRWITAIIAFQTVFIVLLVLFAYATRHNKKKKKEFQTQTIIVLAYLLTLISVVGGVIYLITVVVKSGVNTSYGILSFLLTSVVYLCTILLFIPPVVQYAIDSYLNP